MKYISSQELRQMRNDFWESKKHVYLPEASLIGGKESTAMFTIAGMQQLIPYLSGKKHPLGTRFYNIQKCLRTIDIDEVGDESHLTFFHMMGNRSLGDYFKKEAVKRSWEFLVKVLEFDPKKLAVTVFQGDENAPRDEETANYWESMGIPKEKIAYLPAEKNRRSPGPLGPCGPDTEIFYRVGEAEYPPQNSNPGNDENNWLEIRNNVFMEFYRDEDGKLTRLKNQNVDTGMGFERMVKILQNKKTVYETDLFWPLIEIIEKNLNIKYEGHERRIRIIVDHLRASFFLINDGIFPSNEARGYVLRRLIRRMFYNLILLKNFDEIQVKKVIQEIVEWIGSHYEGSFDLSKIFEVIFKEINQFQKTIFNGQKMLNDLFEKYQNKKLIPGLEAFKLYDSYGFPFELTLELANEKGFKVDEKEFTQAMEIQQEKSRSGSKDMFKQGIDRNKYLEGVPPTKFIGYQKLDTQESKLLKDFEISLGNGVNQRILVFDSTPFYAESGGQMGDTGKVILNNGEELIIKDVKKHEGIYLHFVQ